MASLLGGGLGSVNPDLVPAEVVPCGPVAGSFDLVGVVVVLGALVGLRMLFRTISRGRMEPIFHRVFVVIVLLVAVAMLWNMAVLFQ